MKKCSINNLESVAKECSRAALHVDIVNMATSLGFDENLLYSLHPAEIRVQVAYKKGELQFAPATDLSKISASKSALSIEVACGGYTFYLTAPGKPASIEKCESAIVPFWWVGTSSEVSECNMVLHTKKSTHGFAIPVLQNSRGVKAKEKLLIYQAPKAGGIKRKAE